MRINKNKGTIDLAPITMNIVNLQGLKLICRKTSQRYEKNTQKERSKSKNEKIPQIKTRQFRTNKIYFKQRKQRDDQIYFSDYKIKYGIDPQRYSYDKNVIHTAKQLDLLKQIQKEQYTTSQNFGVFLQNNIKEEKDVQKDKPGAKTSEMINKNVKEYIESQRNVKTKLQKRKISNFIKFSFSHKNYLKPNLNQIKGNISQVDHRLDGWAVQSPLICQVDKKLDITCYGQPQQDEAKNYFSERKNAKEIIRFHSRSKKIKF